MIRRLLAALWTWAATRRDDLVSRALEDAPPGPIDRDLARLRRESLE